MLFSEYWECYGCRRYAETHEERARMTWEDQQKMSGLSEGVIECYWTKDEEIFEPVQKRLTNGSS